MGKKDEEKDILKVERCSQNGDEGLSTTIQGSTGDIGNAVYVLVENLMNMCYQQDGDMLTPKEIKTIGKREIIFKSIFNALDCNGDDNDYEYMTLQFLQSLIIHILSQAYENKDNELMENLRTTITKTIQAFSNYIEDEE